jgi:hypothetical protein
MKTKRWQRGIVLALMVIPSAVCVRGQAEREVAAEIERVDALLANVDSSQLPKGLQDTIKPHRDELANVKALQSPLLQIYRLREPLIGAETLRFVVENAAATKSLASFEALWSSRRSHFESKGAASKGPVLQAALVQSGLNRAEKLFRASLPYGKVASPGAGVYYLAEAEGNLRYATFVDSLALPAPKRAEPRPTIATLRTALDGLERETIALFEKDPASRTSIPVSARLKETRELLDQGRVEATTLMMLESHMGLARRTGTITASTPATPPAIPAGQDTLADLYLAMASDDQQGDSRRLIHASVLPFYLSLTRSGR